MKKLYKIMSPLLLIYVFNLVFMAMTSSYIVFWITMEVNVITFLLIMKTSYKYKTKESKAKMMFYFLIQSIGSISFLLSCLMGDGKMNLGPNLTVWSIIFKMSLFPLHFWIFKLVKDVSGVPMFLLMTLQKVPYFIILYNFNFTMVHQLALMNFMGGILLMYKSKDLKELVVSSSVYGILWIIMFMKCSAFVYIYYMLAYSISLVILIKNKQCESENFILKMLYFIFSAGMPPFSLFFLKMMWFKYVGASYSGGFILILVLFISFAAFMCYFLFFVKGMNFNTEPTPVGFTYENMEIYLTMLFSCMSMFIM